MFLFVKEDSHDSGRNPSCFMPTQSLFASEAMKVLIVMLRKEIDGVAWICVEAD